MTILKSLTLIPALAVLLALPGHADTGSDAMFRTGVVEALTPGQVVTYDQTRSGPKAEGFRTIEGGAIILTAKAAETGAEPAVQMAIEQNGQRREMQEFPASGGNPVLMVFLEDVTRSMAAIAGGSPFYIRNRMKEALSKAKAEPAGDGVTQVVMQPFAEDPNAPRMGDFAELKLTIRMKDGLPGYFESLTAETVEGGYHEAITARVKP
ncbi:hypothetical protein ACEYYB_13050 [Paracoccus sp. p4-l81]|uniref:hypothetical protein n=1 Tax=Paracoccus sp. p4-l81 TaxID=3342806 RepID=UPI0035BA6912